MSDTARPDGSFSIRLAGPADAQAIAALSRSGSTEPWSAESVAKILGLPGFWSLVAEGPDAQAAGFLIARVAADEAEIVNLVVAGEVRRRGIGRALLAAAIECARRAGASAVFLEVAADNPAGCALYESFEFREVGRRRDYYRRKLHDYVDALIMKRLIVNSGID
jgi:ribosomal-protein-alanine N-acetyltransferase